MSRPKPTTQQLLECADRLARELHEIEPPMTELSERLEYVMWGRKQAWAFLEDGIITEVELRNLLIDHFDYECAHLSGRAWKQFDRAARERIIHALDQALFGREASWYL